VGAAGGSEPCDLRADPLNDQRTVYEYDDAGRLTTQTAVDAANPDKNTVTTTRYDGASRITEQQSGDRITRFIYDRDGLQVGAIDALGYLTENKFDAAGRLVESIRYTTKSRGLPDADLTGPVWLGASLPPGTNDQSVTVNVTQSVQGDRSLAYRLGAFDADGDVLQFELVGQKPAWLTIDTDSDSDSGVTFTGVPPVSFGNYAVRVRASDQRGKIQDVVVQIVVSVDNHAPGWDAPPPPQQVTGGNAFHFIVPAAVDPDDEALTYSVLEKPDWLSFNASTRELSGTSPNSAGTHIVRVQARDALGLNSTLTLTVNVNANQAPTWAQIQDFLIFQASGSFEPASVLAVDPEGERPTASRACHLGWASTASTAPSRRSRSACRRSAIIRWCCARPIRTGRGSRFMQWCT
jgi:hypothetical protein